LWIWKSPELLNEPQSIQTIRGMPGQKASPRSMSPCPADTMRSKHCISRAQRRALLTSSPRFTLMLYALDGTGDSN
jgi:hypothetical protein